MNSIDEFLTVMPPQRDETGRTKAGLCVRYSASRRKWTVAYGVSRSKKISKSSKDQGYSTIGIGDTPLDAANDLVEKIKLWNDLNIK